MAEKGEVLDYLRNQQKAAEIEAKVNGINIWVLFGAIAVVAWQLTSMSQGRLWNDLELVLRTLVATLAAYLLFWFLASSNTERDELRYSRSNFVEVDSPFLVSLKGVLIFLPPAGLSLVAGASVGGIGLGIIGIVVVAISIGAALKPILRAVPTKDKFPKPEFGITRRTELISNLLFGALFAVAIAEQIVYVQGLPARMSIEDARQMGLLAVLYLLMLITVGRKLRNDGTAWTYDLETDLVLGAASPEVAVRRIENRRLGPKLQDVMDHFFDDLDRRFALLEKMLAACEEKVYAAKQVPEQYPAERAARFKEGSEKVSEQIEALGEDCKAFGEYLKLLEQKPSGKRAILVPVLAGLKARHESYDDRVRTAKLELKRLLS